MCAHAYLLFFSRESTHIRHQHVNMCAMCVFRALYAHQSPTKHYSTATNLICIAPRTHCSSSISAGSNRRRMAAFFGFSYLHQSSRLGLLPGGKQLSGARRTAALLYAMRFRLIWSAQQSPQSSARSQRAT